MAMAPIDIEVKMGPMPEDDLASTIAHGLFDLMEKGELCDVIFAAGGKRLGMAHRAVLAAASVPLRAQLAGEAGSAGEWTVELEGAPSVEAVRTMLEAVYGAFDGAAGVAKEYAPSSDEANKEVLRLAQRFALARLEERAARWVALGLTTTNVTARLATCEEFGLTAIRTKIIAHLVGSPAALMQVAKSDGIIAAPVVLQDLLVQVLTMLEAGEEGGVPQAKKARKMGA